MIGRQGTDIIVEVFHPFPIRHLRCGLHDRLDEVQGHLVVLRHPGGHGEVVQVLPVIGEVLRYMVFIPQDALHAPDQLFHRAVVLLAHLCVGGGGIAGAVQHRLADGIVQFLAVHAGEHLRAGLLGEVLPAPVVRADGVGGGRLGLLLRRLGRDGQQGHGHGASEKQGQNGFSDDGYSNAEESDGGCS